MSGRTWAVGACAEFAFYLGGFGHGPTLLWFTFACSAMALTAKESK